MNDNFNLPVDAALHRQHLEHIAMKAMAQEVAVAPHKAADIAEGMRTAIDTLITPQENA